MAIKFFPVMSMLMLLRQGQAGKQPDFVADIRDLRKIKSSIADEILAVHVIEHFYYWEVVPLLQS